MVKSDANADNKALHFTGQNIGGVGLYTTGGVVMVWGAMAFDNGATLAGGEMHVEEGAELTLGPEGGSTPSTMCGGTLFNLFGGILNADAGFTMSGGTLRTGGESATINLIGCNNVFQLTGGLVEVTVGAVGTLTINGTFTGTGGTIVDNLDTAAAAFGTLRVNGDVNLGTGCFFYMDDVAPVTNHVAGTSWRGLFTWSGTRTGTVTFSLPSDWTGSLADNNLVLTET